MFEGLKREQINQIVRIQAKRVAERLAVKKISLELADSAVDYLVVSSINRSDKPVKTLL